MEKRPLALWKRGLLKRADKIEEVEHLSVAEQEVDEAAEQFSRKGELCFARGEITNEGFSATLSFNSSTFSGASGSIDIVLNRAKIEFIAPDDKGPLDWGHGILSLIRESEFTYTKSSQIQNSDTNVTSDECSSSISSNIKGGLPGLGAEISGQIQAKQGTQHSNMSTSSHTITQPIKENQFEIQQNSSRFTLYMRPRDGDLSSLNPSLSRISIIHMPEPYLFAAEDIKIYLSSPLDTYSQNVTHSLKIKSAKGAWAPLKDNTNKRIISEIVISKILQSIHQRRQVWP